MQPLDEIDQHIVAILRNSARLPLSVIAKQVGRSRTAVQARIERLERWNIIRGYHAEIAGSDGGQRVGTIITIFLRERLSPEPVVDMLMTVPEVVGCYRVTGEADLVVTLAVTSRERLEEICEPIWRMAEIRTTNTVFVMKSYIESRL